MQNINLNVLIGQINPIVGDIEYNENKIIEIIENNKRNFINCLIIFCLSIYFLEYLTIVKKDVLSIFFLKVYQLQISATFAQILPP